MKPADFNKEDRTLNKIELTEQRKLKAGKEKKKSVWSGLGMFGMVGWSVAVPTLLGTGIGVWLDRSHPQSFSWTLTLLVAGLFYGCWLAWFWVKREQNEINKSE